MVVLGGERFLMSEVPLYPQSAGVVELAGKHFDLVEGLRLRV